MYIHSTCSNNNNLSIYSSFINRLKHIKFSHQRAGFCCCCCTSLYMSLCFVERVENKF